MVQNLARPVLWSLFTKKDFQIINQKGAISSLLSWQTKMQPRDHEQKFDYKWPERKKSNKLLEHVAFLQSTLYCHNL